MKFLLGWKVAPKGASSCLCDLHFPDRVSLVMCAFVLRVLLVRNISPERVVQ